jgi:hypothetical protein
MLSATAQADAVSDFYKGKRVKVVIGFPPGGVSILRPYVSPSSARPL